MKKQKVTSAIFNIAYVICTIFSAIVLIRWCFFGMELTRWQLITTSLWFCFAVAMFITDKFKKRKDETNDEENQTHLQ